MSNRTSLAVKYEPGEAVLISHVFGGALDKPKRCTMLGPVLTSRLFDYQVQADSGYVYNVRDPWVCPADVIIEEVPDLIWE